MPFRHVGVGPLRFWLLKLHSLDFWYPANVKAAQIRYTRFAHFCDLDAKPRFHHFPVASFMTATILVDQDVSPGGDHN